MQIHLEYDLLISTLATSVGDDQLHDRPFRRVFFRNKTDSESSSIDSGDSGNTDHLEWGSGQHQQGGQWINLTNHCIAPAWWFEKVRCKTRWLTVLLTLSFSTKIVVSISDENLSHAFVDSHRTAGSIAHPVDPTDLHLYSGPACHTSDSDGSVWEGHVSDWSLCVCLDWSFPSWQSGLPIRRDPLEFLEFLRMPPPLALAVLVHLCSCVLLFPFLGL